jgi:hypothetical protein
MFKTIPFILAALTMGAGAQAAPALVFQTASTTVTVGDSFEVLLRGEGFGTDKAGVTVNSISGGQGVNLSFSSGLLELVAVAIDPRWSFSVRAGVIDAALGTVTGMRFGSFPATPDDDFDIARLTLRALGPGNGALAVTAATFAGMVGGAAGKAVLPSFGQLQLQIQPVANVPEPQHWALLLAGLGVLGLRLRRA